MADTLAQFQREFNDIKALAHSDVAEQKTLLLSIRTHGMQLESGFKLLGLRLRELIDEGHPSATIDDFMDDREVVDHVHELTHHRETLKANTTAVLHKQIIAKNELSHRLAVLTSELNNQIEVRGGKFSSKALRVNQSVKQMGPLLQEAKRYEANSADLKALADAPDIPTANSYDPAYAALMTTTLSKAKVVALKPEQQQLAKRLVDTRVLATSYKNAKVIYDEVVRQATKADQAKLARKAQGLSEARAAAQKAVTSVKALVEPYTEAIQEPQVAEYVSRQKRSSEIKKSVNNLLEIQKLVGAKAKYILDLRM